MEQANHPAVFKNNLKGVTLHVYIKEPGFDRRGALPQGTSSLSSGKSAQLTGFRGKSDLSLIVVSKLVSHQTQGKQDGLKIKLGSDLHPASVEFRTASDDTYEVEIYFDEPIPDSADKTHIDAEAEHPGGG